MGKSFNKYYFFFRFYILLFKITSTGYVMMVLLMNQRKESLFRLQINLYSNATVQPTLRLKISRRSNNRWFWLFFIFHDSDDIYKSTARRLCRWRQQYSWNYVNTSQSYGVQTFKNFRPSSSFIIPFNDPTWPNFTVRLAIGTVQLWPRYHWGHHELVMDLLHHENRRALDSEAIKGQPLGLT